LKAPHEVFEAHNFDSEDVKSFVKFAREKKEIVRQAAAKLEELPILQGHDDSLLTNKRKTQHFYSDFINRCRAKEIEDSITDHTSETYRARFHSNNGSFAGAWLFNVPTDKHSTLSSRDFRIALKLRLGVDFHNLLTTCCCAQRELIHNNPATHLFSCNEFKPFHLWRHNSIQDDIMQMAQHGGVRAIDAGLSRLTEEDGRKGDILFPGFGRNGTDLVVDICIANACAKSYVRTACDIEGHAMSQLENRKIEKYQHAYQNVGVDFLPLALEIHGVTSETFKKFIRRLATEISDANDIPYCIALSYWQRRMSTTLQRMNATILRSTQVKISRRLGMMREVDLDPNDHTFNDRHTSLHDMTA